MIVALSAYSCRRKISHELIGFLKASGMIATLSTFRRQPTALIGSSVVNFKQMMELPEKIGGERRKNHGDQFSCGSSRLGFKNSVPALTEEAHFNTAGLIWLCVLVFTRRENRRSRRDLKVKWSETPASEV